MKLAFIGLSTPSRAPVIQMPIPEVELQARLALRIADAIGHMGLQAHEINACCRIGIANMNQGATLTGAYVHAVKVARRIIFVRGKQARSGNVKA